METCKACVCLFVLRHSYAVAQVGLELTVALPQPRVCWECRWATCPAQTALSLPWVLMGLSRREQNQDKKTSKWDALFEPALGYWEQLSPASVVPTPQ